jgi:hypothetical protein
VPQPVFARADLSIVARLRAPAEKVSRTQQEQENGDLQQ